MKIILQKIIAASGYTSRRKAEQLIHNGSVKINGRLALVGDEADPALDNITVQGHPLGAPAKKIYIKLNKPAGYTCTNRQFKDERNIFELIKVLERLFVVGRLDKDSRGLVLVTNDGDLDQYLSHPKFQNNKIYEAQINGEVKNISSLRNKFLSGIDIQEGDGLARAKNLEYLQNNLFIITLTEGKKRQIRRMFQALNLEVSDLKRVAIAGLTLGNLQEGQWAYLSQAEINELIRQTAK